MKNKAFTLAEVLITLGIIGVVAAMTIPTLIANINGARNRALFKETLSILNQAVRSNVAHYDFDFASTKDECNMSNSNSDNPETNMSRCSIFDANLKGYTHVKYNLTDNSSKNNSSYSVSFSALSKVGYIPSDFNEYGKQYLLPNGAILIIDVGPGGCELPMGVTISKAFNTTGYLTDLMDNGNYLQNCIGFIDINGTTPPNQEVTCSDENQTTIDPDNPCVVKNDAKHMTDIFPIIFHNGTVEPLSNAARYVLNTAK